MADDQVKYSDLISEDVAAGFELLNNTMKELKETMAALKTEATGLGSVIKGMGTATRDQQKSISDNAAAVDRLNKRMKDLSDEEQRLEDVSRRYKKLTDEQVKSVDVFQQAMQGTAEEQIKAASAIDVQVKSYNELQATYNALKDTLNAMTTAERESSQAGKVMTITAMTIRDKMNELQKATGNYTLQVGKYKAAFDGLGFSFMQIAREAPSALNLNQFFLAISNNLPMFFDQIDRFKTEQKEIKQTLADLAAQGKQTSDEYTKIAAQQTTVFKRLATAVFSLQGAVLVFTMLLRFLPKIVDWFKKMANGVGTTINRLREMRRTMDEIDRSVYENTSKARVELEEINRRLANVTRGTTEWYNIVARVNEITHDTRDATKAMPDDIAKVTAEYIKQAEQLAKNQFVIDKISESANNSFARQQARTATTYGARARALLGNNASEDDIEDLVDEMKKIDKRRGSVRYNRQGMEIDTRETQEAYDKRRAREYRALFDKYRPTKTEEELLELWNKYYQPLASKKTTGDTTSSKDPSEQSLEDRYWEAEEALLKAQNEGYGLERALAKLARDKARDEQNEWYVDQRLAFDENLKNGFFTQEEYDIRLQNLDEQNKAIREGIEDEYWETLRNLRMKNLKERSDEWKANAAEIEKTQKEDAKRQLDAEAQNWEKRRTEMVEQGKTRKEMLEAEFAAEIARLNIMKDLNRDVNGEKMSDEQRQKIEEWIKLLERLKESGNFRGIKLGSIFGKGASGLGGEKNKSGNYTSISDLLWPDLDSDQTSALNSVFDQAKEALNGWMDARKKAADQAKELADDEVSAAENALNREIELRNQGYANDVALKERELADAKERQKKAAEMQKKAEKDALAVNTAMEASSMAVAIANLFKDFPLYAAIPLTAVLLGSFAAAKVQSFQAINSTKYREGGVMLLEGGSHQSGHDVNLGIGPDGSNLRAEGGEYFAVINKRNSRKYGSEIPAVVNALNSGMFEDRYIKTSDAVGLLPRIIRADDGSTVDLSAVESGVGQLVKQGERSWSTEGEYRVMRYKNLTRRVRMC